METKTLLLTQHASMYWLTTQVFFIRIVSLESIRQYLTFNHTFMKINSFSKLVHKTFRIFVEIISLSSQHHIQSRRSHVLINMKLSIDWDWINILHLLLLALSHDVTTHDIHEYHSFTLFNSKRTQTKILLNIYIFVVKMLYARYPAW